MRIGDMVEGTGAPVEADDLEVVDPEREAGGGMGLDFSFLLKPTGPGAIEDYLQHPLNPRQSRGLAQTLRGATGFFGDGLRAAIADILFGLMEYSRERRVEAAKDADTVS